MLVGDIREISLEGLKVEFLDDGKKLPASEDKILFPPQLSWPEPLSAQYLYAVSSFRYPVTPEQSNDTRVAVSVSRPRALV